MQAAGVALVTGASRGIGRAVALVLARAGFDVVASMRDPDSGAGLEDEAAAAPGRLRVAALDVRRPQQFSMPEGLRVLVNSAALDGDYLPVEHTAIEQWREMFETNVFGLVETTRCAIPALRESGGGVICNVTSSSLIFPMPFYAVYRASKAAVSALGESLRAELAPHGIRILEIMPGPIATDMLEASDRPPEAVKYPAYRALAERAWEGRRGVADSISARGDAAQRIVAAILAEDTPLRAACDPLGEGMLAGWRAASDEDWLRSMLASLGLVP